MDVTREVDLEAPLADVWELLTDVDELATWLADAATLDVRPGGTGTFEEDGRLRRVVVEEVDAGRRLGLRWWTDGDEESASRVDFTLTESESGTHLTVTETFEAEASVHAAGVAWAGRLLGLEWQCLEVPALVAVARG
jgi:uncharacterized protein YndB with AHSA1/START domain